MHRRVLVADPKKCNGCSLCRTVCSMLRSGFRDPSYARIRIIRDDAEGFYLPVFCQQCQQAPCMAACPREAIYRDSRLNRVMVDYERCVSCRMCMAACPFGAIGFEFERHTVFRCDQCDGDPPCVRYCFPGALAYVVDHGLRDERLRRAAGKVAGRSRIYTAKGDSS